MLYLRFTAQVKGCGVDSASKAAATRDELLQLIDDLDALLCMVSDLLCVACDGWLGDHPVLLAIGDLPPHTHIYLPPWFGRGRCTVSYSI